MNFASYIGPAQWTEHVGIDHAEVCPQIKASQTTLQDECSMRRPRRPTFQGVKLSLVPVQFASNSNFTVDSEQRYDVVKLKQVSLLAQLRYAFAKERTIWPPPHHCLTVSSAVRSSSRNGKKHVVLLAEATCSFSSSLTANCASFC